MQKLLLSLLIITPLLIANCIKTEIPPANNNEMYEIIKCLQDEINTLKQSKPSSITVNAIEGLKKPTVEASTIFKNRYIVDLHGCTRSNTSVTCNLTLTNKGKDTIFYIYGGKVFDERGEKYKIESVSILKNMGNKGKELISLVPVPAQFSINNIPTSSTQLTAIKLSTQMGNIEFRGIAIK